MTDQAPKKLIIPEMELEKAKFSSEAIFHDSEGKHWLDFSLYMILV